jgi:ubiquinone/menaquinone biosynthesis C-methylase UbiE
MGRMTTAERTAAFWDSAADSFDSAADHGLVLPRVRAAWAGRLREWLPGGGDDGSDVLDVGCGTGSVALLLAEQGHRVTGVDLAPRMVERARRKLTGRAAEVVVGDAARPPVGDRRFDVVLCRHLLWTLPDPVGALRRWTRLLRPGGHLVLIEGRWGTPTRPNPAMPWWGGVGAGTLAAAVAPLVARAHTELLTDPALWGHPIDDERFVLLAHI